jgi:hypothetical protein
VTRETAAERRDVLLPAAIVIAVVAAVFGRVIGHPFVAFDDAEMILRNPQVTAPFASWTDQFFTPRVGYIVPVTVGVEAALYALSGGKPWSFHAAAVLLHALIAVQLLAWAHRETVRPRVALCAALLFALHPLAVQPVAWAVCLKDLLMANLVVLATRRFTHLAGATPNAASSPRRRPEAHAAGTVVLLVLAMLAKPSATLVGFAWLACLAARRAAGHRLPVPALLAAGTASGLGLVVGAASRYAHDAAMGVEHAPDWTPTLPIVVLGRQVRHVSWPADLAIAYAPPTGAVSDPDLWLGAMAAVVLVALLVRARRNPQAVLLLGLALATYVPTSNVLPFARLMSDSYMLLPLFAFATLGALAFGPAVARRPAVARAAPWIAGAVLVAFALTSHAQIDRWRGGAALWQPVIDANPDHADAHRLLGDEHVFRREPELAVEPYRTFFALRYESAHLVEFASLLAMAGRTQDAECVGVEAFLLDADRAHAAYNLAVLFAFHPDYTPRYPSVARRVVETFAAMPPAAPGALPPELAARLGPLRARLANVDSALPAWRPRTCAILRGR